MLFFDWETFIRESYSLPYLLDNTIKLELLCCYFYNVLATFQLVILSFAYMEIYRYRYRYRSGSSPFHSANGKLIAIVFISCLVTFAGTDSFLNSIYTKCAIWALTIYALKTRCYLRRKNNSRSNTSIWQIYAQYCTTVQTRNLTLLLCLEAPCTVGFRVGRTATSA